MTINRRQLLGSVAATAICAPPVLIADVPEIRAETAAVRSDGQRYAGWLLARETKQKEARHAVDFWTRPLCDIDHLRWLPPEISRGVISYEETTDRSEHLRPVAEKWFFRNSNFDSTDGPPRYACHLDAVSTLSSTLRSLIVDEGRRQELRTALVALDSGDIRGETNWADLLPAFRSCYDRIIGHFHLPERGFRQELASIKALFDDGYLQEYFAAAAAQCDAVVFTSIALTESDLNCSAFASRDDLAGKLMHDFGRALLAPVVLDQIAGDVRQTRKPRLFALASLTLNTMDNYDAHFHWMKKRQNELVRGSFGASPVDESMVLVVSAPQDSNSNLIDEVRRNAGGAFFTVATPSNQIEKGGYSIRNSLDMIALWPFMLDKTDSYSA